MKFKLSFLGLLLVVLFGCNDVPNKTEATSESSTETSQSSNELKGTWELTGFYNYKDNVVVDSFSNNLISRQVKMYSDNKVMWCKLLKTDSIEFFGYGNYNYGDGQLTESLEFGSAFMNDVIKENKTFTFQLKLYPDRFEQIEIDDDGNRIYSENYIRVE